MEALRVLIVDDDPLVLTGLRLILRSMPEFSVVAEASDGGEVLAKVDATRPDVVLSDVKMRVMNGTSIIAALRQRHPDVRIVLMSAMLDAQFEAHVANLGADAFVHKTASAEVFRAALSAPSDDPRQGGRLVAARLSAREQLVAVRVAQGASNADISAELGLSVNTVKTYVSRIMRKLGVSNRVHVANLLNPR